jgi:hypothetical protein
MANKQFDNEPSMLLCPHPKGLSSIKSLSQQAYWEGICPHVRILNFPRPYWVTCNVKASPKTLPFLGEQR